MGKSGENKNLAIANRSHVSSIEGISSNAVSLKSALRVIKMVPFDRPYTTFYLSVIVTSSILYHFLSYAYLTLNNIVTLKCGLEVNESY